jgi:hypothetical protein
MRTDMYPEGVRQFVRAHGSHGEVKTILDIETLMYTVFCSCGETSEPIDSVYRH